MLAFVDESGDPGMKLGKGSSDYLIITMVVFDSPTDSDAAIAHIAGIRQKARWRADHEFHFNKMSAKYRSAFLEAVKVLNFRFYSIVIDKAKLESENFRKHPDSLYKTACNYLFSNGKKHLRDAHVVVDGSGGKLFKKQFCAYLRKRANEHVPGETRLIRKVQMEDSAKNSLIQLADMVCGAVARSFSGKKDAQDYRRIVKTKEAHVQVWPR